MSKEKDTCKPKQVTMYDKHFRLIDSAIMKNPRFNTSGFVRWALENKLSEYMKIK